MSRKLFLVIASVLAFIFGFTMLLAPSSMLENMATVNTTDMAHVLQWGGTMLITIGLVTFLSRNDPGSTALRAVLTGNIFMHIVALVVDIYDFKIDFIKSSGLISGSVVHGLLIIGFIYFLRRLPNQQGN